MGRHGSSCCFDMRTRNRARPWRSGAGSLFSLLPSFLLLSSTVAGCTGVINRLLTTVCHAMDLEIPGIGAYSGDLDSVLRA
jgi:hypothetical protein